MTASMMELAVVGDKILVSLADVAKLIRSLADGEDDETKWHMKQVAMAIAMEELSEVATVLRGTHEYTNDRAEELVDAAAGFLEHVLVQAREGGI